MFPGFAESGGGSEIVMPGARRIFFPGCPADYRRGAGIDWLDSYGWLNKHHKTPMDLGLVRAQDLDPRWYEFVALADAELGRQREERTAKAGAPGG